ncbi:hypothetical protein L226DRAFT_378998 [Lentinus tigrinus ALCF2SS1-7]|uniref:uncharacterized protein n=1 Tax=Lentinus tigrinus ALCF2SS1-7 TaxID=1328758 RepID=UPI00116630FE|nr:hypothetical protein L226DRAFT_378998 [Lentinus tigrinus ALCF2SS1-7]
MLPSASNVRFVWARAASSLLTSAALRSSRSAGVQKFSQVGITSTSAAASLIRACSCAEVCLPIARSAPTTLPYAVAVTGDSKRACTWNTHACQTCVMNHRVRRSSNNQIRLSCQYHPSTMSILAVTLGLRRTYVKQQCADSQLPNSPVWTVGHPPQTSAWRALLCAVITSDAPSTPAFSPSASKYKPLRCAPLMLLTHAHLRETRNRREAA